MNIVQRFVSSYLLIDLMCVIGTSVILTKVNTDIGNEREIRFFKRMNEFFILYLLLDMVWALGDYQYLHLSLQTNSIIRNFTQVLAVTTEYFWYRYTEVKLGNPREDTHLFSALSQIPLLVILILYGTSYYTGAVYRVGAAGKFYNGPYSYLPALIGGFYLYFSSVHTLIMMLHEKSKVKKKEYRDMLLFIIAPTIGAFVSTEYTTLPLMALSIFFSVFMVFISMQENRINTDALTGLSNRRRVLEYIENGIAQCSPDNPFCVFMIDANSFKSINDRFGHGEGDRALRTIANALRGSIGSLQAIISRTGGDEFVVAGFRKNMGEPVMVKHSIKSALKQQCEKEGLPYFVSVSIGEAECTARGLSAEELVTMADGSMYREKSTYHAAN